MSPTALSLRHLRAEGWTAGVVERRVPGVSGLNVTQDYLGIADIIALRGPATTAVQTTSVGNINSRLRKITDDEHRPALDAMLAAGWFVVCHGWRLSTRDGHACTHGRARCGCRWTLHRCIEVAL